ncbi:MAG: right-handed parallel beta-helix repeat-containing protein, partial [Thermoplasmata archaeon]|nr:right-handed parallel beta-helix repeat-containing protein [Thermoplasmata archaeon]
FFSSKISHIWSPAFSMTHGFGGLQIYSDAYFYNCIITNNLGNGIEINKGASIIMQNTTISNSLWSGISGINGSATIYNSTFINNLEHDIHTCAYINLINCSFDDNKIKSPSTLFVKWYLDISILDENGNGLSDVNVTIKDNYNEALNQKYISGTDGDVNRIILTEYIQNSTNKTYYTPHTLIIEKDGLRREMTVVMDENKEITITLDIEPTLTGDYLWIIVVTVIILGSVATTVYLRKRKSPPTQQ